ncbi:MAG: SDR family NAD(P)-dependent oxidoreductase [Woeseia sp.]|nr:SDR family NAD(P)-dependent oxidoreductase [Woeseia sp.]MBT8096276.1 SDR family NAD(P)-dependent oxidoreductase [Woeseia sp.]
MDKNFHSPARTAVIGATGGIGAAFVSQLAKNSNFEKIYALARSTFHSEHSNVSSQLLDFASESSIETAAEQIRDDGPLDLIIVATGILHRGDEVQPEKSMADIDAKTMAEVLAVNTIGPALVAKHFLPLLRPKTRTVFAVLSARVGSIADNRLGGWLAYRSSKAALNMTVKTLSVEHARKRPESLLVGLHPGTVATNLSEPFTGRVAEDKLFSPERAASQLLDVIEHLPDDASGGFFAWDGKPIPF